MENHDSNAINEVSQEISGDLSQDLSHESSLDVSEFDNKHEWLRHMYSIAWDQYSHEDNLNMKRYSLVIAVQAAAFAFLAAISIPLLTMEKSSILNYDVYLGHIILGFILTVLSIFELFLTGAWVAALKAGPAYVRLRLISARAIEIAAALDDISLANIELRWKKFMEEHPDQEYNPFETSPSDELRSYRLSASGEAEGWSSVFRGIRALRIFWICLSIIGLIFLFDSLIINILRQIGYF